MEACHEDGNPYAPATVNNTLSGPYHYTKLVVPNGVILPDFINTKDSVLYDLCRAMEVPYRDLHIKLHNRQLCMETGDWSSCGCTSVWYTAQGCC